MNDTQHATEPEAICDEMRRVRRDLNADYEQVRGNAEQFVDWKYYVQTYPWACLSAAAALGFLAVPRRLDVMSPDAETLGKLAGKNRLVVTQRPYTQARPGLAVSTLTFLGSMAIKLAAAHIGRKVGDMMANWSEQTRAKGERHEQP